MALTNCSECNAQVSDKAASCPTCGNPIADNSPFGRLEKGITVKPSFWHDPNVGAVAGLIAFLIGCGIYLLILFNSD